MSDQLYPYTDETPEERRVTSKRLVTANMAGRFIFVNRAQGEHGEVGRDTTVFVPYSPEPDWIATIEGAPNEPARAFVIQSIEEARNLIDALEIAVNFMGSRKANSHEHWPPRAARSE